MSDHVNVPLRIRALPEHGPNRSILLTEERSPVLLGLHLRTSTTAHGRVKAAFAVPAGEGLAALAEFRIEMN